MRILNRKTDAIPPDAIYVGRGTKFGNPFRIGPHATRAQVIERYHRWLWVKIKTGRITHADLRALDGHDLVCSCAPAPCHAEIIRRAVQWALND